jgi:hypothetical protein
MLFNPILAGIKHILENDADTKDVIKGYYEYILITGIRAVPFCLLGSSVRAGTSEEKSYLGDVSGIPSRTWGGEVSIMLLGRAYENVPSRYTAMSDIVDKLQSDAYDALKKDDTLHGTALKSRVDEVRNVIVDEYFGFEIVISIQKIE